MKKNILSKKMTEILKQNYMKKALLFLVTIILFAACTPKSSINGTITDAEGKTIYLEHTGLNATTLLDSAKLNAKGGFSFAIETPRYPDFYRVRIGGQSVVFAMDSKASFVKKPW